MFIDGECPSWWHSAIAVEGPGFRVQIPVVVNVRQWRTGMVEGLTLFFPFFSHGSS